MKWQKVWETFITVLYYHLYINKNSYSPKWVINLGKSSQHTIVPHYNYPCCVMPSVFLKHSKPPGKVFSLIRLSLSAGFMFLKAFLRLNADARFLFSGYSWSSKSFSNPLSADQTESLLSFPSSVLEERQQFWAKFDSRSPWEKTDTVYSLQGYLLWTDVQSTGSLCEWLT